MTISITLSPIPPSVKDHKFMLQVAKTSLSSQELTPEKLQEVWKSIKEMDESEKEDHKLRVALQSADLSQKANVKEASPKQAAEASPAKEEHFTPKESNEEVKAGGRKDTVYKEALENNDKNEISEWQERIK